MSAVGEEEKGGVPSGGTRWETARGPGGGPLPAVSLRGLVSHKHLGAEVKRPVIATWWGCFLSQPGAMLRVNTDPVSASPSNTTDFQGLPQQNPSK